MGDQGPLNKPATCITAALGVITACGVSLQGSQVVSKCDDCQGSATARKYYLQTVYKRSEAKCSENKRLGRRLCRSN